MDDASLTLPDVFTASRVGALAGMSVYARGLGYHREGRVELEANGPRQVSATVRGAVPYAVELGMADGEPTWSCTCPFAEDGSCCKHVVAVALASGRSGPAGAATSFPSPVQDPGPDPDHEGTDEAGVLLGQYVSTLPSTRLVELVLDAANADWRLRERLLAEARAQRGDAVDLATWHRRIDLAFAPYDDYVPYREAHGWAQEVDEVIDAVEDLCDAWQAQAVIELTEYAHRRADEAIQYVDDSDGWLTTISDRLSDLHLAACDQARPDPVELAGRLVDLELTSELDGFHRAAVTHADVLGEAGLAAYRELVERRWHHVTDDHDRFSSPHFAIREARIGVALASGDPDELIAVRRDDLRVPNDYLEVARTLLAADRVPEAEEWMRTGLSRFPDRPWQTDPLRDALARLLRGRGHDDVVVELFWEAFEQAPSLVAYRRLVEEPDEDEARTWRERAVSALRDRLATAGSDATGRRGRSTSSVLVEILAYEGRLDEAWSVAAEHGCTRDQWLILARAREDTHPLEAIQVYEDQVFTLIDAKRNQPYRQAVDLLSRIRQLAGQADRPDRFEELLARVRAEHHRKRNLKKLLDDRHW